jgi:cytochrome c553
MKLSSGILTAMSVATIGIITLQSCESEGGCGKSNISHNGSHESHNNGANCMTCHKSGGEGEGCFNLAGSVYNGQSTTPLSNVTVNLYSEAQGAGELRFTLKGDALGNFFTTDDVTYSGLFASVTGPSGTPHYMSASLSSASCNSCHGVSTDRLNAN